MVSQDTFLYFAYGSNMSTKRLWDRVASARLFGNGQLEHHALRWHKRSLDGSGKCDAEATGVDSDVVWGVLFEINCSEKYRLDAAEGLHYGYEEKEVGVVTDQGIVKAMMHYATNIKRSLRPYDWYKDFVVAGAKQHALPEPYLRNLEEVKSKPDQDGNRAARNEKLLSDG